MTHPTRSEWLGPAFEGPARRIVSLVPSLTDAVFRLGAGAQLVGRTEFCVRPVGQVEGVPIVGGTKNADPERVAALAPDVVLANREENTRPRVERIAERCPVWLTEPRGPADVPALWSELGAITARQAGAERSAVLAARLDDLAARAATVSFRRPRALYLIWKQPWMAAGSDTYIGSLLETAGFDNALPLGDDDDRYPRLEVDDLVSLAADVYLLSSEPYPFRIPADLGPLAERVVGRFGDDGVLLRGGAAAVEVDGKVYGWYPSRTLDGLEAARRLRERVVAIGGSASQARRV